jgi:hypothetical protein
MLHGDISADLAKKLQILRARIDAAAIPPSKLDESLNFASWNIRDFGKKPRTPEAIHMIAEIINQFDLIALVELRDDLSDLRRVMEILGPFWKIVFCDARTDAAGNHERVGYLYDKRMAVFTGLAAEADPPRKRGAKSGNKKGDYEAEFTWWRSPYMASFSAGSFDFTLLATHMRWGRTLKERATALKHLAEWIDDRRSSKSVFDKDIILVGDFNIPKVGDQLYQAITSKGLQMPAALEGVRFTNVAGTSNYDQILHYSYSGKSFTANGGVVNFYQDDHAALFPGLSRTAFTFQLSDHFPLWVQLDTDIEGIDLDRAIRTEEG